MKGRSKPSQHSHRCCGSHASLESGSLLVRGVAPWGHRIVVRIVLSILQFQVIHFLEQGLIHLHVVPGCEKQDSLSLALHWRTHNHGVGGGEW